MVRDEQVYCEYEVLSADRRSAVDIFVKAVLLASAFLSVAFTVMLTAKSRPEAVASGLVGLGLLTFFMVVAWRCRRHDELLQANLDTLGKELGFAPVIPTRYIFNIVLIFGCIIFFSWVIVWSYKVADPTRGMPWPNPLTITPGDGN